MRKRKGPADDNRNDDSQMRLGTESCAQTNDFLVGTYGFKREVNVFGKRFTGMT